jgi:outer membrane lipoprotein LolB
MKLSSLPVLLFCLFFFLLSACTSLSPPRSPQEPPPLWASQGAIGFVSQQQGWSASFYWEQWRNHYRLQLYGPLGVGQILLRGSPQRVSLITSDQRTFTATKPEQLLLEQTGWKLPVSNLVYWIRGLPSPRFPFKRFFDSEHRLHLSQQGWDIRYEEFVSISQQSLPAKITLTYPGLRIRIIIRQWQTL